MKNGKTKQNQQKIEKFLKHEKWKKRKKTEKVKRQRSDHIAENKGMWEAFHNGLVQELVFIWEALKVPETEAEAAVDK